MAMATLFESLKFENYSFVRIYGISKILTYFACHCLRIFRNTYKCRTEYLLFALTSVLSFHASGRTSLTDVTN